MRVARRVRTRLAGRYRSAFRGPGLEFEGLVPYASDHDVQRIDWLVTARRGRPFVRRYVEERELRVLVALDVSPSMATGARERALLLLTALALSAARAGDRSGAVLFADQVVDIVPATRGRNHALDLVRRCLETETEASTTDPRPLLRRLLNLRGHAAVFLLSDFLWQPPPWDEDVQRMLGAAARKHDLLAVRLLSFCPDRGAGSLLLDCVDPEAGRSAAASVRRLGAELTAHRARTRAAAHTGGVHLGELPPGGDDLLGLERLLSAHGGRSRRRRR